MDDPPTVACSRILHGRTFGTSEPRTIHGRPTTTVISVRGLLMDDPSVDVPRMIYREIFVDDHPQFVHRSTAFVDALTPTLTLRRREGLSTDSPWTVRGQANAPRTFRKRPALRPDKTGAPWSTHGEATGAPYFSIIHGQPVDSPWTGSGRSMGRPRTFHGSSTIRTIVSPWEMGFFGH